MKRRKNSLTDEQVDQILLLGGYFKTARKKKASSMTEEYRLKRSNAADKFLNELICNGVPSETWEKMNRSARCIITTFCLNRQPVPKDNRGDQNEPLSNLPTCATSSSLPEVPVLSSSQGRTLDHALSSTEPQFVISASASPECGHSSPLHTPFTSSDTYEDELGLEEEPVAYLGSDAGSDCSTLSLKRLLQHWAVYTNQKLEHLSYLLKLLRYHKPLVDYDSLPTTGEQLLYIDGRDFVGLPACVGQGVDDTTQPRSTSRIPLPSTVNLHDGHGGVIKYMHFGLESALKGDSPGMFFKHSNLLQYGSLYAKMPHLLPVSIKKKIRCFDTNYLIRKAQEKLTGDHGTMDDEEDSEMIPHFIINLSSNGVQIFENSENAECIPIMVSIYGICPSPTGRPTLLETRYPIVVGVAHGKSKPTASSLMRYLFAELDRLNPNNSDPVETAGREFTVSLRCVVADWIFRSYLKRIKGHGGYWSCERCIQSGESCPLPQAKGSKKKRTSTIQMKDLNAPLRTDQDFLTYIKSDDSLDDHLLGLNDLSPFVAKDFPMVSGFPIDPMHTLYAGCFKRRLKGLVSIATEGRLSSAALSAIDDRLKLFEMCKPTEFERILRSLSSCVDKYKMHELRNFLMYNLFPTFTGILNAKDLQNILLLQNGLFLLGGFDPKPVLPANIDEASRVLKLYVQQLISYGYPIRPTVHAVIHLPEDVRNFECGVECQSAFVYENFYRFFRTALRSGSKPLEQIRNRLVERSKYLLPTASDGTILETEQLIRMELKKWELQHSGRQVVLSFSIRNIKAKSICPVKTILFPTYRLSTCFPNNVVMLKNGSIVVCVDLIEYPNNSKIFKLVGFKFLRVENAFVDPYVSSDFKTYLVHKLDSQVDEWNVNCIMYKMYAMPMKLPSYETLPDITESLSRHKWFVTPIRHTLSSDL